MQTVTNFSVRVQHNNGIARIKVSATSEESAKKMVCAAECCPESAVLSVRKLTK